MPRISRLIYYIIFFLPCQVLFLKKYNFCWAFSQPFEDMRECRSFSQRLKNSVLFAAAFANAENIAYLLYRVVVLLKLDYIVAELGVLLLIFYGGQTVDLILY